MNRFERVPAPRSMLTHGITFAVALTLIVSPVWSQTGGAASDGPGVAAAWTTGNKLAVGTSANTTSQVWFTVAKGITTEVFYPRLDVPNMQDMQYIITDGATFVDLERDSTSHAVSMPDEMALEYTITNTDTRNPPKYKITNSYITDPDQNTLLIRTRFQSLDGGSYQLYLLENASMAGGGANNNAWWDPMNSALIASGSGNLFGSTLTIVSALKVASPNGFVAHEVGYSGAASDCYQDVMNNKTLAQQFDSVASNGNVVECGKIGGLGADTTFTVALGYGSDAASAEAAANASLASGFTDREAAYRGITPYSGGWEGYVKSLRPAPASVASNTQRSSVYYVAAMALHAAEDKTFRGASIAGFATPWGDYVNGDNLNDGYHRVWGRDLYQQAMGLIAAGDSAQALRMAQFLWDSQYIGVATGKSPSYLAGAFPRYSPVSGSSTATPQLLGCCEQFDEEAFAIVLAWMTGLTDSATYQKIKTTANHFQNLGPVTTERWEEQYGRSPSSIAAEIAGLVAAADIARQNGDPTSASSWESTADSWLGNLPAWTFTTVGYWGGGQYYERIDPTSNPNDMSQIQFNEGLFYAHDIVDFGFLDSVRLGELQPADANVSASLAPTAAAFDGNSPVQVTMQNGDVYFIATSTTIMAKATAAARAGRPTAPTASDGFGPCFPESAANMSSPTGARPPSTSRPWPMQPTTATSCRSRSGIVWTSLVSPSDGRRAAPLPSTGPRANTFALLSRSMPAITSTRLPWSKPDIGALARSAASPASASMTPMPLPPTATRSRSLLATGPRRRVGPGTAATVRCAYSASAWT